MLNYTMIIPIINGGWQLEKQLPSIPAEVAPKILLIVDNSAGKDPSIIDALARIYEYKNLEETKIVIYYPKENLGCSASWNYGIKNYPGPWIIANADVFFNDGTGITKTLELLQENAMVLSCGLSLFGLKQEAINAAGYFDENFWPAYNEDLDYVSRLSLAHSKIGQFGANVIHEHSTAIRNDAKLSELVSITHGQNDQYFIEKWGTKNPNTFEGPHVYGKYLHPFNDPSKDLRDCTLRVDFVEKKKKLWRDMQQKTEEKKPAPEPKGDK